MKFVQTRHPVIEEIPMEVLLALPPEEGYRRWWEREEMIRLEREDPHHCAYELPLWRKVDLAVARKRVEIGGHAVIQLLCLGGIRSSKTHFASRRLVQHQVYSTRRPWVWGMHESETSSQTIGQKWVHHYLPNQYKTESGKVKGGGARLNYTEGKGFTGMGYSIGKRVCEFRVYGSTMGSQQGSEITMGWADELVPPEVVTTLQERTLTRAADLMDPEMMRQVREAVVLMESGKVCPPELLAVVYHGVNIITFCPKEGYTPVVADFLDSSRVTEWMPAKLLPVLGPGGEQVRGPDGAPLFEKVPLFRQSRKKAQVIVYFPNECNPFGNFEGLKLALEGAKKEKIRIDAYGDVGKAWGSRFPKFGERHVVPVSAVPAKGTWYHRVDPCDGRNFFMSWWKVCGRRHFCVREWPQLGDYIEGVGDPGDWAVTSQKKKFDGDPGPAQESFGFGLNDYVREMRRVERELWLEEHGIALTADDGEGADNAGEDKEGQCIQVYERHMDSRFGNAPTPSKDESTTLIEQFEELGVYFEPAPGEHLSEGVTLLNDLMAWEDTKEFNALNCPRLYVVERCAAMIYGFQNWTGKDGQKGACKDPVDTARYHALSDPEDVSGEPLMVKRGRSSAQN